MYISWICDDLGGVRLYAGELIDNPDADASYYMSVVQMADRLTSYNIVDHFGHEISEAIAAGTDYNSGIIKLARIYNGSLTNNYLQFTAGYQASTDTVYFRYGNGDGTTWTRFDSLTYTPAEYMALPLDKRCVSFAYRYRRSNYRYDDMPSEFISTNYFYIWGPVNKLAGHYEEPTLPSYPYGRVVYQIVGEGLISDIPGGATYAAADNAASRASQSQLAADLKNGTEYAASTDFYFCAYDGSHDDVSPAESDPNADDPEGPSRPGGWDGNHSRKTEAVTLPDLPALGALDAGMITLYRLTGPEMSNFTSELWTFWSAVKAFFADPLDFVIGCMIMPFTPDSTRQARPKFGSDVWNTAFDVISEQFYSISCGTIDIEKYYGSCFDYDPYHKLEIYIPYVGYRELPVDQVMGKTIELTYHIDCMSGDFVAFVHTPVVGPTGPQLAQIICQFAGTMGVHVPLSRESFDAMVSAGINLLGGAVGMAAGGIAQAAGLEGGDLKANQIASQASAATVSAVNAGKRNVIRSGSIGASSGMLAKQNPFIISTLPRQSLPENYKDLEGYPSNIYGTVGSFPGYLAVETIKLNVTATSTEKEMIMQLLKGGVFV